MILYEWVYNRGEIAEGLFCSEKCAEDTYFDNPRTCYKGGPSPLDEQESEELAADWKVCSGCGKPLKEAVKERVMSKQHTPGPWIAKLYEPDEDDRPHWGVRQSPDAASVSVDGEALPCGFGICNIVEQDMEDVENGEERANAELIAAAPETAAERDRLKTEKAELVEALKLAGIIINGEWMNLGEAIERVKSDTKRNQLQEGRDALNRVRVKVNTAITNADPS